MKNLISASLFFICFTHVATSQKFDPVLAGKLQNTIDSLRTANNVKGVSARVIHPVMGIWNGVSGISHAGAPITSDMVFGIGSNTKLFTGVLLLKLAENNLIKLDDSLHSYIPPYNNINPNITIRQLLNHTSGLYDVTSVPGYPDSVLTNPNRIFTAAEMMKWMRPPLFAPGKGWSYCNTNYLLAGMIIESVTGKSYGKILRDSILFPLQLDSTFLDVYENVLYTVAHPWQAGVDNFSVPRKALNSAAGAAGAMYSTADEMTQWYQALMGGKFLKPQSFKEMTTFVGSGDYGIGISRALVNTRTVWTHGGTIWGGYNSVMMYDTASGAIICVLTNQLPAQAFQISAQLLAAISNHTVGINERNAEAQLAHVFPNPSSGEVHVDVANQRIACINVFNAAGQLVKAITESTFSIADLPNGMYILTIQTDNGVATQKLIKH